MRETHRPFSNYDMNETGQAHEYVSWAVEDIANTEMKLALVPSLCTVRRHEVRLAQQKTYDDKGRSKQVDEQVDKWTWFL